MLISLIKEPKIFPIVYLHFLIIFQGSLLSRWKKKYWYSILNIHIKIILAKSAFQLYHISIIMRKILWPRSNASIIAVFLFHLYLRQCLFVCFPNTFGICLVIFFLRRNISDTFVCLVFFPEKNLYFFLQNISATIAANIFKAWMPQHKSCYCYTGSSPPNV